MKLYPKLEIYMHDAYIRRMVVGNCYERDYKGFSAGRRYEIMQHVIAGETYGPIFSSRKLQNEPTQEQRNTWDALREFQFIQVPGKLA